MYLESSKDILYLVLAFCALLFTVFVCWMLAYVIKMLRDASNLVGEVRDKLAAIEGAVKGVKEKLEHSASYLGMVAAGVKMAIDLFQRKAADKVKKTAKKAKEAVEEALDDK